MSDLKCLFLYDGDCGVCNASVAWLESRGAGEIMRFAPSREQPEQMLAAGLTLDDCARAAYIIEPRPEGWCLWRGAAAINHALALLPRKQNALWRFIGRLYAIPGLRQLENWGYVLVARNRHRLQLGPQVCMVPPREHGHD